MPRFLALLVLAGVAVAAVRPRRAENATQASRFLDPREVALLRMPSPSKARH